MELQEGLRIWTQHTEAAALAEHALGRDRIFRLDFERLSADPEPLLRELCAFLGEPYSPDCLISLHVRINSSEVDERRQETVEGLEQLPAYQECLSLYGRLAEQLPLREGDSAVMESLREQFVDYCRDHPLI